ncbi:hypothetical protein [Oceaniglobus trochenteri]|uniref:hypothetical protein n=1 Tax=Oceaniglobus trochenteri TaxID=2763260 RepID=UPI001D00163C|nr:hypothetical protein [Oceaniglobus trochenteri]
MTKDAPLSPTAPQPHLSMFDVYSGYVLTQGRNALMYVVMWERVMRFVAIGALVFLAAFWFWPGAVTSAEVLPLKLVLSGGLAVLSVMLFWAARPRPQYECQVDLVHCEFRQILRAASGIEKLMLRIRFDEVTGLFIRPNRAEPMASCLFMEVCGADEPLLLGVAHHDVLGDIHRRINADLAKARTMPQPQRPMPQEEAAKASAVARMQAA